MRAVLRSCHADGIKADARRAENTCPAFVKWGAEIKNRRSEKLLKRQVSAGSGCSRSAFCTRGMFMAGAPVGDVPAHRPRGFYAGSTAMNVKARVCAPKGLALTEWPLPAKYRQGWAERRKFFFRVINHFGIAPAIHPDNLLI